MPDAFIGIDVIVGFPGETEADFRTTCDFLTGIAPAFLHIFPFSERPGTPAVDLPGKVPASVASERVKRLEALCDEKEVTYLDVWGAQADHEGRLDKRYTNDGLHLTGEGYVVWRDAIKQHVK